MNDAPASMQIIEWQQFLETGLQLKKQALKKQTSVTVGVFDGVHRGHQELITRVVSFNTDYVSAVITFRESHKIGTRCQGLGTREEKCDIISFQQRLALFEKLGIQVVVVIDFTEEFRQMSGIDFLQKLLDNGNVGYFAVGNGFKCGYQLDTDAEAAKEFFISHGITAEIIPQVMENNLPISSSRIRTAIYEGNTALAQLMLGHENLVSW